MIRSVPARRSPMAPRPRQHHPLFTLGDIVVYLVAGAGWVVYIALVYKLISLGI